MYTYISSYNSSPKLRGPVDKHAQWKCANHYFSINKTYIRCTEIFDVIPFMHYGISIIVLRMCDLLYKFIGNGISRIMNMLCGP